MARQVVGSELAGQAQFDDNHCLFCQSQRKMCLDKSAGSPHLQSQIGSEGSYRDCARPGGKNSLNRRTSDARGHLETAHGDLYGGGIEFAAGKRAAPRAPGGRMSWNMFSRFGAGSDPDIVSFGDLEEAIGTNAWTVVDVREPHEFASGHIPNALNMPMSSFRSQGPAGGKAGRSHLSGGRTVAQCAEQGAGDRARGCETLCRGHERLALAQRPGDALKRAGTSNPIHLGAREPGFAFHALGEDGASLRGSPAT